LILEKKTSVLNCLNRERERERERERKEQGRRRKKKENNYNDNLSKKCYPGSRKYLGYLVENNPSPLPAAEAAPPPTTNMSVAPPPPNKNIEFTVKKGPKPSNMKKSYAQASKANITRIEDIMQVKEVFPDLLVDGVGKVLKVKNSGEGNKKPKINMMTRGPSRKEVIIPMANHIAELIVNSAHIHITNVNKCLKNSKSDIVADFIRSTNNGIIITTNKPANNLNLSTIEKYLKSIQNVDSNSIESPCLPKSKSYMKIIGLSYKID